MLPTKLNGGKLDRVFKSLILSALEIREERLAGYPRKDWLMSFIEFRVFVLIEALIDERMRIFTAENALAMKAMAGMLKG